MCCFVSLTRYWGIVTVTQPFLSFFLSLFSPPYGPKICTTKRSVVQILFLKEKVLDQTTNRNRRSQDCLKRALVLKRFSKRNEFSKLAGQLYLQLLFQNIETILNWFVNLWKNYSKTPRFDETSSIDKFEQLFSKKNHEK